MSVVSSPTPQEEAFEAQLADLRREMQAAEARHEEEAAGLRSSLDEALGRAQQLGAEKEEAVSELTNLREVRLRPGGSRDRRIWMFLPIPPSATESHSIGSDYEHRNTHTHTQDHDTLRELMEFTQGKNADLEKALAEAKASAEQLDKCVVGHGHVRQCVVACSLVSSVSSHVHAALVSPVCAGPGPRWRPPWRTRRRRWRTWRTG